MRQLIAALVVLLFAASCVPANPSERDRVSCYARFYAEDYQAALAPCQRSAEHGHAVGKYLLGLMYAQGLAVPKEERRGVDLMRAAAEMGYSDAQKDYGIALQNGVGVPQNSSEACSWWERSALQNNFLGQQYAAACYLTGQGVGQDSSRGYAYLLLARDGGNREAGALLETIRPQLSAADLDRAEQIHSELRAKIDELRD
jgi:TPR repeat protein